MRHYWGFLALVDFTIAILNIYGAMTWSTVSWFQLLSAAFCIVLGVVAIGEYSKQERAKANRDEDARIQHLRDNWPWN